MGNALIEIDPFDLLEILKKTKEIPDDVRLSSLSVDKEEGKIFLSISHFSYSEYECKKIHPNWGLHEFN